MVYRGAVERIGVGLVRCAAPDLIGPRARRKCDQLTDVESGREQRDLADRELGAQFGVGGGDAGRGSAHYQGVEREGDQLEDEGDLRSAARLDLDLLLGRAVPKPAYSDPVQPRFEVRDPPRAIGVGDCSPTTYHHFRRCQGSARGVDHAAFDAAPRLRKCRRGDLCREHGGQDESQLTHITILALPNGTGA